MGHMSISLRYAPPAGAIGASLVVNWNGPACVLMHGANPGLVSHLVKQALLNIASDLGMKNAVPQDRKA